VAGGVGHARPQADPVLVTSPVIRAAGGVVVRQGHERAPVVALIHRPKYDDWSLPKGKLHPGEDERDAAIREVLEETGLRCEIERDLGVVRYADRFGRPKIVRYFAMTCEDGPFTPTEEVDEMRWSPLPEAAGLLSYEHDAEVLRSAVAQQAGTND